MRLPHPSSVDPSDLAKSLRLAGETAVRVDGDRDHMNHSNLTTEQTMVMAKLMLVAADKLNALSPADPFQHQMS